MDTLKVLSLTFFMVFLSALFFRNSAAALAADATSNEGRDIENAIKKKQCFEAEELIQAATVRNPNSSDIPEWNFRLFECYGRDRAGFVNAIRHYFDQQVKIRAKEKPCSDVEKYVNSIDRKFDNYVNRADWWYSVARCYEREDQQKGIARYKQILTSYPNSEAAVYAQFRLNWIQGDRKWVFSGLNDLIKKVRKAILLRDEQALNKYASKSSFKKSFGEQSKVGLYEIGPAAELAETLKKSKPLIGEIIPKEEKLYLMQVVFVAEDYPFWYFEFRNMDGGWQWTGIHVLPQTGRE